jgi:hypothetical protein
MKNKKLKLNDSVGDQFYFHLSNGAVLKSARELLDSLEGMDDGTFRHHVNQERNDFSNWINDVYGSRSLAEQVRGCTTKDSVAACLRKAIQGTAGPQAKAKNSKKKERKIKQVSVPSAKKEKILSLLKA